MDSKEYFKNVRRTESPHVSHVSTRLMHGVIGICTESGELADVVKKAMFYNRPLETWHLVEEVGDLLWYAAVICHELDITFEEVMDMNIAKLRKRYPEQFTEEDERNRDYDGEREAANKL